MLEEYYSMAVKAEEDPEVFTKEGVVNIQHQQLLVVPKWVQQSHLVVLHPALYLGKILLSVHTPPDTDKPTNTTVDRWTDIVKDKQENAYVSKGEKRLTECGQKSK